ncbi:MAG: dephospho-CoA kinase [Acidobacteriaceae bacterium]
MVPVYWCGAGESDLLRVGLTGGIGSGKSTVAGMFRELGIPVIEADAVGRALMEPGESVYRAIVEYFGPEVVQADGRLDRGRLAEMAFRQGRLQELNALVHPPVIAAQEAWMGEIFAGDADAVAMVESALIFEASRGEDASVPGWRDRFDRVLLVTAPDEGKIARYVRRVLAGEPGHSQARADEVERDARARLARQIPDAEKIPLCDAVIDNSGTVDATRAQVARIAAQLRAASKLHRN